MVVHRINADSVLLPQLLDGPHQHPLLRIEVAVQLGAGDVVDLLQDQAASVGLADLAADHLEHRIDLDKPGVQRLLVLIERGNGLLVGLLLRVQPGETGIGLRDQRLGLGLEVVGPEALEFELELQALRPFP